MNEILDLLGIPELPTEILEAQQVAKTVGFRAPVGPPDNEYYEKMEDFMFTVLFPQGRT